MMKRLSPRDRLIAIILPGMLVLLGYLYVVAPKQSKKFTDVQKKLADTRARLPQPSEMDKARRDAVAAERAAAAARSEATRQREAVQGAALRWLNAARRTEAADRLTLALQSEGIVILNEQPATGASTEVQQALQKLRAELTARPEAAGAASRSRSRRGKSVQPTVTIMPPAQSAAELGRAWEIRFVGDFMRVWRVLETLQHGGEPVLPLSLTMAPPLPGNPNRLWTLTVWK